MAGGRSAGDHPSTRLPSGCLGVQWALNPEEGNGGGGFVSERSAGSNTLVEF